MYPRRKRRQDLVPPAVGAKLAKRVGHRELTPREMEILGVAAAGKSNKEIGVALNISEATVKVHMTHIMEKLKVTGRTEAMNVAVKRGLILWMRLQQREEAIKGAIMK